MEIQKIPENQEVICEKCNCHFVTGKDSVEIECPSCGIKGVCMAMLIQRGIEKQNFNEKI